ncbi:hypothetical protein GH714_035539 [Hevea brasiliensis]|uniref:Pentacotripeptide-repeat region of PRORP domain-containing protein n=1 Tax=Hevea brasiliensis TaxID=3981 RepID=A0A6A6KS40_HEVBR|nr:hypothetical protein GH714_035539 [Hevea brasiliensis]
MLPTKSRKALLASQQLFNNTAIFSISSSSSGAAAALFSLLNLNIPTRQQFFYSCYCSYSTAHAIPVQHLSFNHKDVVQSFKEWFQRRNSGYLDLVFEILSTQDEVDDLALSQLGLHLTESLVLEVLHHGNGKNDVLSCLKFFDWAGHQHGFYHTRATFHAIFKILSKAKLMPLMLDFLDKFMTSRFVHHKFGYGFYGTLVIGYSVAGKPQVALQLFSKMRFQGLDLDGFAYHVLLNSLVEESYFDVADCIARQISLRGFENHVTRCIVVKSLCKQELLDEAASYLRRVILHGDGYRHGDAVGVIMDALCQNGRFDKAGQLVEEIRELGVVPVEPAYRVWLRNLVQAGKLDTALKFLQQKKSLDCYVPGVCEYNALLWRVLKNNRLAEACDLLMEMMESGISADKVTFNAALCFFCKAGMVDVALELFNCKSEFGLSPSSMACNYLINSLCREGNIDEAYNLLTNFTEHDYFPGRRTFSVLADALCREGKVDMMKELVSVALERNFMPSDYQFDKFISALCRARRLEDAYLMQDELNTMNIVARKTTYSNLIYGFNN